MLEYIKTRNGIIVNDPPLYDYFGILYIQTENLAPNTKDVRQIGFSLWEFFIEKFEVKNLEDDPVLFKLYTEYAKDYLYGCITER